MGRQAGEAISHEIKVPQYLFVMISAGSLNELLWSSGDFRPGDQLWIRETTANPPELTGRSLLAEVKSVDKSVHGFSRLHISKYGEVAKTKAALGISDHRKRLEAMVGNSKEAWNLNDLDRNAIRWALDQVNAAAPASDTAQESKIVEPEIIWEERAGGCLRGWLPAKPNAPIFDINMSEPQVYLKYYPADRSEPDPGWFLKNLDDAKYLASRIAISISNPNMEVLFLHSEDDDCLGVTLFHGDPPEYVSWDDVTYKAEEFKGMYVPRQRYYPIKVHKLSDDLKTINFAEAPL